MAKSYYAILGITSGASQSDVKTAYRRLAKEFHPDRYAGTDRPFLEVQEAYSVLSDSGRRREYDAQLSRNRPEVRARRSRWDARAPEPLVPRDRGVNPGRVSPRRSFQAFAPSFDEMFDWLWENVSSFRPFDE